MANHQRLRVAVHQASFQQLIKYGIIGIVGLGIDFGFFEGLSYLGVTLKWANFISSSCALIHNFFMNRFWTFKVKDHWFKRFIKYYLVGQVTTLFTTLMLFLFVQLLGYNKLVVKICATLVATILQFGINKGLTFRR